MFNVDIGEVFVILLVCLVVFGPERFPEMARQAGRLIGQLQLLTQSALEQLKEEAGNELNLPDLRVGSLRAQARDYLRELMDIDAQMAEFQRERQRGDSARTPSPCSRSPIRSASTPWGEPCAVGESRRLLTVTVSRSLGSHPRGALRRPLEWRCACGGLCSPSGSTGTEGRGRLAPMRPAAGS
jgi:sec-independent protein translocase protein TatB